MYPNILMGGGYATRVSPTACPALPQAPTAGTRYAGWTKGGEHKSREDRTVQEMAAAVAT